MKKIVILGSTGSIGINTLNVARKYRSKFKVTGLSTYKNVDLLAQQIAEFSPEIVCVTTGQDAAYLKTLLTRGTRFTKIVVGIDGLKTLASYPAADTVLVAVVGAIGLYPLISAIKSNKTIALANKESLVIAGSLITKLNPRIIPVDSEHSALFQCIKNEPKNSVHNLIITGSGGPFLHYDKPFKHITVDQALAHPKWKMGKKITVDSATLMNKGLEIIEAHNLFNVPYKNIKLLIHPQSIVHALVEFVDGAVVALLSEPDMKLPIQYALTYPDRLPTGIKQLSLTDTAKLEFYEPNLAKFPCITYALDAARTGGTMPSVMNASNETAVNLFLSGKILFTDIPRLIEKTMTKHKLVKNPDIETIVHYDGWARRYVTDGTV
jgi:1-deoxy-D-xylulose-5-phosphate reductoisomerase